MAFLQPFLDLLPYRLEQALGNRNLRRARVRRRRRSTKPQTSFMKAKAASQRRLFIDLSVISKHDAGTGIQRVVRALALALIEKAGPEWEVHFVAATRRRCYHLISWPAPAEVVDFVPMEGGPGDVFIGLDYSLDAVRNHRRQLAAFRRGGGALWFLVHDLLPQEKPEWFSRNTVIRYRAWLGILADTADGFLCNSLQTEQDLKRNLDHEFALTTDYRTVVLPMGHKITDAPLASSKPSLRLASFDRNFPFFLMVGTLEPRKGHADVLAAFNHLWQEGANEKLVLVGKMGWQVNELREAILHHPEHGRRLFWFDDVDDVELHDLYEKCSGGIIASHAEGFGLPLIETLSHGKPVLARDLAIFHPHAGAGVNFFPAKADTPTLLACLRLWIGDVLNARITVQRPDTSWEKSASILIAAVSECESPIRN
ncbi:MAG TPA: glycosyltransferase family 1 protein [Novosphingobium capsulatum]|nr:glycosyltransferase family 1 protein [Novosphingobium capsulatum]